MLYQAIRGGTWRGRQQLQTCMSRIALQQPHERSFNGTSTVLWKGRGISSSSMDDDVATHSSHSGDTKISSFKSDHLLTPNLHQSISFATHHGKAPIYVPSSRQLSPPLGTLDQESSHNDDEDGDDDGDNDVTNYFIDRTFNDVKHSVDVSEAKVRGTAVSNKLLAPLFKSTAMGMISSQHQTQINPILREKLTYIAAAIVNEHGRQMSFHKRFSSSSSSSTSDPKNPLHKAGSSTTQTSGPVTSGLRSDISVDPTSTPHIPPAPMTTVKVHNSSASRDKIKAKTRSNRKSKIMAPNYGPDADRAFQSLQNARKERARAKTAANVRRALYGNTFICVAKLGAWLSSGSSSMMSEFVHSVVDCGNQSLLLMGLRDSRNAADKMHPYGYGKSVYFWALVSALGTFFMGAGISMSHSIQALMNPSLQEISWHVWTVLGLSFVVDGYVFTKTVSEIRETKPAGVRLIDHIWKIRDPATLAILLEDGAACLGILIAIGGISASHITGMPVFDGAAGVGISCLLGSMGMVLVRVNHSFLLGQGVDREIREGIETIILDRRSIDNVYSIQSQWTGPETFSFKAEVDFDGTFLAAQLMPRYQGEFRRAHDELDQELEVLLCWYAEDVMRAVEREVRHIEAKIRQKYPGAEYIELEPMSKDADKFAIDDSFEEKLQAIERQEMQSFIRVLYQNAGKTSLDEPQTVSPGQIIPEELQVVPTTVIDFETSVKDAAAHKKPADK